MDTCQGSTVNNDRLPKAVFCGAVEGQGRRGHPMTRQIDNTDNDTEAMGLTPG